MSESEKPPSPKAPPKWETDARDRIRAALRKFTKPLADLAARDANEGDTRLFVTDFLCEALGYDKYADLTTEYMVKGEFADYGVRIDQDLIAFIEVKRVTTKLGAKHLRQLEMYAVNEGVEWMVLTSGVDWQVYHLAPGMPVEIDLTFDVNLLSDEPPGQKADKLFFLSRESMKRHQIDELWKARRATSPKSLATVLLSDRVVDALRKEMKSQLNHTVEAAEIVKLLKTTVIRLEALG